MKLRCDDIWEYGSGLTKLKGDIARNGASSSVLTEGAGAIAVVSLERLKSILQYLLFLKIDSPSFSR